MFKVSFLGKYFVTSENVMLYTNYTKVCMAFATRVVIKRAKRVTVTCF